MRYYQNSLLVTALFLCLLSCRETIGEQHKPIPKENTEPPPQQLNIESPVQKDSVVAPIRTLQDKKNKKKKKKASDTLRPKVAVL